MSTAIWQNINSEQCLAYFLGDWSQLETLSEIKPPLIQSIIEKKPHKDYDGFELNGLV